VFSPDGSRVAYVSTQPNGHFNIYIRPIRDGAWTGPPVAVTQDRRYKNDRLYFGAWDMHVQPAWTPDGKNLLMLSNRDVPLGSGDVWKLPAVENGIADAKRVLSEQTLYRTRPDISLDGKRFIYASSGGAADQFNHLYVLPVEGGAPYKMTSATTMISILDFRRMASTSPTYRTRAACRRWLCSTLTGARKIGSR
jgi:Tol biopolymer transport system component